MLVHLPLFVLLPVSLLFLEKLISPFLLLASSPVKAGIVVEFFEVFLFLLAEALDLTKVFIA
jgi:hypothetical protein